jgi:soluble lytic murein transglycosylase-like protein
MFELHDFADKARPYARILDAACVAAQYSQLALFTQICAESSWDPNAVSPTGAIGLAQIEPQTAAEWNCDPSDPTSALHAMASQMKAYGEEFGGLGPALAAYNAGPGAVIAAGYAVPPYPETQNYVAEILATIKNAEKDWPEFWRELLHDGS